MSPVLSDRRQRRLSRIPRARVVAPQPVAMARGALYLCLACDRELRRDIALKLGLDVVLHRRATVSAADAAPAGVDSA